MCIVPSIINGKHGPIHLNMFTTLLSHYLSTYRLKNKVVGVNVTLRVVSVVVSQCSDMNLSGWMSQFLLRLTGLEVVIMGENGTSFMTTVMSTAVWWDPSCHDCHDYHATFMTDTSDL